MKKDKGSKTPTLALARIEDTKQVDATTGKVTYNLHPALMTPEQAAGVMDGFVQRSLPPIIKPREMPIGAFFMGRIIGIMDSPIAEYKNRVLQLERPTDGYRFCFPLTAVISKALGATDEDQDKCKGSLILIKKTGVGEPKGRKKPPGLFEVYLKADAEHPANRAKAAKKAA